MLEKFQAAEKLPIEAWKLGTIVPKDQINMFMYENREDLVEKYGIENEKIHMYKGIVSMSFKGVRAYIVPPHIYQRQIIE
uniref:Uncharacterized protein n=1 Tax=Caenorhabditis japonica TaxID=281687 RepID=A0A8R1DVZ3_CAEJA